MRRRGRLSRSYHVLEGLTRSILTVAVWMARVPAPRGRHDLLEAACRAPPEELAGARRVGPHRWWIPGAARRLIGRDRSACHPSRRLEHLEDRRTDASADVHDEGGVAAIDRLERASVRLGEVEDMDVVPKRRAVRCRVSGAEDPGRGLPARARAQDDGDEV